MEWIVGLNILRLFAIFLILIYHLIPNALPGGYLAVEIFFALAGFLFVGKIARSYQQDGCVRFWSLILGRLRRLFMPLLICVLFTLSFGLFVDSDILSGGLRNTLAALTFTTNISEILRGGSYENSFLPNIFEHTWFLATLMQGYVIVALSAKLFLSGSRKYRKSLRGFMVFLIIAGMTSTALSMLYVTKFATFDRAYFAPDTHIFAFLFGGAYAIFRLLRPRAVRTAKIRPAIALFAALELCVYLACNSQFTKWQSFVVAQPVVAVASIILIDSVIKLQRNGGWQKVPRVLQPLEWLGSLSFGVYLYHWPLKILSGQIFGANSPLALRNVVVIILSVALAILSSRIPSIVTMRRNRRNMVPAVRLVMLVGLFVMTILSTITLCNAPKESTIMADINENSVELERDYSEEDYLSYKDVTGVLSAGLERQLEQSLAKIEEEPEWGGLSSADLSVSDAEVLLIGDSVMLGAKEEIEARLPNALVDAQESRGIEAASEIITQYAAKGKLPRLIVVALATNQRTMYEELLQGIIDSAGANHDFILVTGYAGPEQPRETQNADLVSFANARANVYIADWWSIGSADWSLMYADHIHLNGEGRAVYADMICDVARKNGVL